MCATGFSDYYSQRVPGLKQAGKELRGPCPIHRGERDSFAVNPETGLWKCHSSCDEGGDAYRLEMRLADVSFPEAKRIVDAARMMTGNTTDAREKGGRKEVIAYPYRDASGTLVYEVVRYDPKGFAQRRPGSKPGEWHWSTQGLERLLYRLPDVLADPRTVYIAEGEKDVDTLRSLGLNATCNSGGAEKFTTKMAQYLAGRNVVIVPDEDEPGQRHAEQTATLLKTEGCLVKIARLPAKDPTEWLEAGGTLEQLQAIEAAAPEWSSPLESATIAAKGTSDEHPQTEKKSLNQAETLVLLAAVEAKLFRTPDGEPYADLWIDGHRETHALKGDGFGSWLRRQYYAAKGKPPSSQAFSDAMAVLVGQAQFDGEERAVFVRVAHAGDHVYLDLGRPDWSAVEVTANGWRLVAEPPVRFRRPKGLYPLPLPAVGGRLQELLEILNLRAEDWPLLAGWLVMVLHPKGPYPILILKGEQGTGKTSAAEKIKAILDPGKAALRPEPRELRDLMIAANNGWCMGYDNLSNIAPWLSDAMCRISTGGGFAIRANFKDHDEVLFEATRPILINGIDDLATRSDLLDRTIIIETQPIGEGQRRTKTEIDSAFESMHPRLLGALLDAVSSALSNRGKVRLDNLPRMADFALWATAAEPALQLDSGTFIRSYQRNRAGAHLAVLDVSPLACAIEVLLGKHKNRWVGTPTELHRELSTFLDETGKRGFPRSAKALTDAIRRLAPNLRAVGIEAERDRTTKHRLWILEKRGHGASDASRSSLEPNNGVDTPPQRVTQQMTSIHTVVNESRQMTLDDKTSVQCATPGITGASLFSDSLTHNDEDDALSSDFSAAVNMIEEDL